MQTILAESVHGKYSGGWGGGSHMVFHLNCGHNWSEGFEDQGPSPLPMILQIS